MSVAAGTAQAGGKSTGPKASASIIGGGVADFSRWNFSVAVFRKGRLHCGGSVISATKVLTAAHCAFGFNTATLTIVANRARLSDTSTGEVIPVTAAAVHPDWPTTQRHDVAVLTLASPTSAPPIALPDATEAALATTVGALLRVAGWGARHPVGLRLADSLRRTTEKVRNNQRCKRAYRAAFSGKAMICALGRRLRRYRGFPPIHTSACSGDSGGPLVADTPTGPKLIGTVSYGSSICGFGGSPTVYSRVSDSLAFIQSVL